MFVNGICCHLTRVFATSTLKCLSNTPHVVAILSVVYIKVFTFNLFCNIVALTLFLGIVQISLNSGLKCNFVDQIV